MDIITKPKDPGRVASGKKLVEWNRKKKEELVKKQVPSQVPNQEPTQVPNQEPTQVPNTSVWYVGGTAIILAGVGIVVYLYTSKKKPSLAPPARNDNIFQMN